MKEISDYLVGLKNTFRPHMNVKIIDNPSPFLPYQIILNKNSEFIGIGIKGNLPYNIKNGILYVTNSGSLSESFFKILKDNNDPHNIDLNISYLIIEKKLPFLLSLNMKDSLFDYNKIKLALKNDFEDLGSIAGCYRDLSKAELVIGKLIFIPKNNSHLFLSTHKKNNTTLEAFFSSVGFKENLEILLGKT